jgi:hypothetical protein
MRCKTEQRMGSRPDKILGYRRTTANESSSGIRPACGADEMNDHQVATATDRIRLIAIETVKGAFGNEAPFALLWRAGTHRCLLQP